MVHVYSTAVPGYAKACVTISGHTHIMPVMIMMESRAAALRARARSIELNLMRHPAGEIRTRVTGTVLQTWYERDLEFNKFEELLILLEF